MEAVRLIHYRSKFRSYTPPVKFWRKAWHTAKEISFFALIVAGFAVAAVLFFGAPIIGPIVAAQFR